jgi:hypothetical protein
MLRRNRPAPPPEEDVVIDLRDPATAAWEDSEDLVQYDANSAALRRDRAETVVPLHLR